MDETYWLRRVKSSEMMARRAALSRARLIHFQLAGSYSVKAARCRPVFLDAAVSPIGEQVAMSGPGLTCFEPETSYYDRLRVGAAYLAETTLDPVERAEHLNMARVYAQRARDVGLDG